jgi:hypothetical protein
MYYQSYQFYNEEDKNKFLEAFENNTSRLRESEKDDWGKLWEDYSVNTEKPVLREAGRKTSLLYNYAKDCLSKNKKPNYIDFKASPFYPEDGMAENSFRTQLSGIKKLILSGAAPATASTLQGISNTPEVAPQEEVAPVIPADLKEIYDRIEKRRQRGDAIFSDSVEESCRVKYAKIYNTVKATIIGGGNKNFAIIAGQAGIGKTYYATKALEDCGLEKCVEKKEMGPGKYFYNNGSIGRAASDTLAFLYEHRNNEIIVLDDCDSFLLAQDMEIQNILKSTFTTGSKGGTVNSGSFRIRMQAAQILLSESQKNQYSKFLDTYRESLLDSLKENNLSDLVDSLSKKSPKKNSKEEDSNEDEDAEESEDEDAEEDSLGLVKAKNGKKLLPRVFNFHSKLICISNMSLDDLDSAVSSRANKTEIYLTTDEFLYQLGKIIKNLGNKDTSLPLEEYLILKNFCYETFKFIIESWRNHIPLFGKQIEINCPLEFRIILDWTDKLLSEVIGQGLKMKEIMNNKEKKLDLQLYMMKWYFLPILAKVDYKYNKKHQELA